MGYFIRALPWKKSLPKWKVQFISYKKEDIKNSPAKKPKKEWDVDRDRWRSLGFHNLMTIEEARVRVRQLNAQRHLKEQEKRIQQRKLEEEQYARRIDSVLPIEFIAEFEQRFLRIRDSETTKRLRKKSRAFVIWKAAQKLIYEMQIDPSDWLYSAHEIYDYFYRRKLSLRYSLAILKFVNLWGFFISKKLARPFHPIPVPRGYERQRLLDSFYEKDRTKISVPSKEITPEQLDDVRMTMNQLNFNWVYISVWFGLRPQEVDNLHNPSLWRIETLATGRKILWAFQTKIIALPPEDRWKPIPIIFEQQEFALRIIESEAFKRPLTKTIRKHFGQGTTLYGGRKGFTDLMLSKGQALENISIWMGHSTMARTWRSYKRRRKFHLVGY
ncbi:MAG: hypothetical protein L6Q37_03275 [Bdellovibrionaceae bacterium]|nr:hypothetical protein [Bacteriovoracaceae bacterium]MCK6597359.1 hypothetical protein [Pseudobdellovibrionaceae bacterium]NUM60153.1 hypothetical protein [Pseudobdellovibrionaceae bacterium]